MGIVGGLLLIGIRVGKGRLTKMQRNFVVLILIMLLLALLIGCSDNGTDSIENVSDDIYLAYIDAEKALNDEGLTNNYANDIGEVTENNTECLFDNYADEIDEAVEDTDMPDIELYVSESGLVWVVAPTLGHPFIFRCTCDNFLVPNSEYMISHTTGLLTENYHGGHGGGWPEFVYDRERNLFGHPGLDFGYSEVIGMHSLSEFEFAEIFVDRPWVLSQFSGLIAVQSVDSYLRSGLGITPNYWWLTEDAFSSQFAVMYNRELITDFIFDSGSDWWWRRDFDLIAMRLDGQWGFIDKYGNTALPFIFENLIIIDENTAFARYNGKYGILDIHHTIENKANIQ
jgi:hypothetical protein